LDSNVTSFEFQAVVADLAEEEEAAVISTKVTTVSAIEAEAVSIMTVVAVALTMTMTEVVAAAAEEEGEIVDLVTVGVAEEAVEDLAAEAEVVAADKTVRVTGTVTRVRTKTSLG
jgi:cell division protein FtsL